MIKDRGLMKWHAAFMQPEHIKLLRDQEQQELYEIKPELDEQEFELLGILATESLHYTLPVKITSWEIGSFKSTIGIIMSVDFLQNELKIVLLNKEISDLMLDCIIKIERV